MLSCLMAFSACSEKEKTEGDSPSNGQKLEKVTRFEEGYSSKTRVSEMTWDGNLLKSCQQTRPNTGDVTRFDFNYNGSKLSNIQYYKDGSLHYTYNCSYSGDRLTGVAYPTSSGTENYTITYNSNGEIATVTREGRWTCNLTWQNGNVTQIQYVQNDQSSTYSYTYDNKISSYTGMSVVIFTQLDEISDGGAELLSKNNVLTKQHSDDTKTYTYTYDGDYPLTFAPTTSNTSVNPTPPRQYKNIRI